MNDTVKLFVIILNYKVPITTINQFRPKHIEFLDKYYSKNIFITSGRQSSETGGVIFAKSTTKEELSIIITEDPFFLENLATYEIIEFSPTKFSEDFKKILES